VLPNARQFCCRIRANLDVVIETRVLNPTLRFGAIDNTLKLRFFSLRRADARADRCGCARLRSTPCRPAVMIQDRAIAAALALRMCVCTDAGTLVRDGAGMDARSRSRQTSGADDRAVGEPLLESAPEVEFSRHFNAIRVNY
jgi:hypothetical protein